MTRSKLAPLFVLALTLSSCAHTVAVSRQTNLVRRSGRWALLPVCNYAETPQAGERVEGLLDSVIRRGGVSKLDHYPALKEDDAHLTVSERQRFEESYAWARNEHYDYAITGSVVEWRYKGTIDSEPTVGLTVSVLELPSGKTVFSASGARTGTAGDSASGTALRVLRDLLNDMGAVP